MTQQISGKGPRVVKSPIGTEMTSKHWTTEAPLRMLMNNLHPDVAENPDQLVVYGGIGRAARTWQDFDRIIESLRNLESDQTLLVQSGKPVGVFKTHENAPRVLIANSNLVPNWANWDHFNELDQKGLAMYGQMTAGSFMYIGPQGIVHGTTITILNAARKIDPECKDLSGKIFITSGLGGMSGAQPKAGIIAKGVCIVAEINPKATYKRYEQGWVDEIFTNLDKLLDRAITARENKEAISLAYNGNIVDLWERVVERDIKIERKS